MKSRRIESTIREATLHGHSLGESNSTMDPRCSEPRTARQRGDAERSGLRPKRPAVCFHFPPQPGRWHNPHHAIGTSRYDVASCRALGSIIENVDQLLRFRVPDFASVPQRTDGAFGWVVIEFDAAAAMNIPETIASVN
jgi:hypothetical protein